MTRDPLDADARICVDCDAQFWLDDDARAYFDRLGLSWPKRCPACRQRRKVTRLARGGEVTR